MQMHFLEGVALAENPMIKRKLCEKGVDLNWDFR